MAFKRSWVRLPYPPPAFATSAARSEGCHAVGLAEAGGPACVLALVGYGLACQLPMPNQAYHYVYILVSKSDPSRHYSGCTTDLAKRLQKHNEGGVPHTAKWGPWRIETAIRFSSMTKARAFEAYIKSGSGREFARRHF